MASTGGPLVFGAIAMTAASIEWPPAQRRVVICLADTYDKSTDDPRCDAFAANKPTSPMNVDCQRRVRPTANRR